MQYLLSTVDQHWLVIGFTVVLFTLAMGAYYILFKLSEALDNRAERRETHRRAVASNRAVGTSPVPRYLR